MPDQVPEVLALFQCAICQGNDPVWTSSNRSDHPFGSPGRLMCTRCGTAFKVRNGYLDLHPGDPEPIPPIQHLMQFPPIVAVYEALWRPVEAWCERHGVKFAHLDNWPGYKSGALNYALRRLTSPEADVIGVVDSDYQIEPGFLRALIFLRRRCG